MAYAVIVGVELGDVGRNTNFSAAPGGCKMQI